MNRQQIPPAVQLSVNIISAEPALDGDRHIQADVPVTRVQVHVCGKILRQLELDAAATLADFPMFRGYPGLNWVLAPSINANVGVAGFDTKLRLPRDGISLRPLISAREGRKRKQHEQQRRGKPHISLLTSRTQHYSRVTDADTQLR